MICSPIVDANEWAFDCFEESPAATLPPGGVLRMCQATVCMADPARQQLRLTEQQ
ncbi:MAG: hypothetical protein KDA84_03955 [Planctomycetaceae bacterium]|nr:hypothetical protein [Planctomycetaceae bacterium]